jgi:hypothetical protein
MLCARAIAKPCLATGVLAPVRAKTSDRDEGILWSSSVGSGVESGKWVS